MPASYRRQRSAAPRHKSSRCRSSQARLRGSASPLRRGGAARIGKRDPRATAHRVAPFHGAQGEGRSAISPAASQAGAEPCARAFPAARARRNAPVISDNAVVAAPMNRRAESTGDPLPLSRARRHSWLKSWQKSIGHADFGCVVPGTGSSLRPRSERFESQLNPRNAAYVCQVRQGPRFRLRLWGARLALPRLPLAYAPRVAAFTRAPLRC